MGAVTTMSVALRTFTPRWTSSKPCRTSMRTGSSFRVNDLGASAALSAIDAGEAAAHKTKLAGVIAFYPSCRHDAAPSAPAPILIGDNDEWTPVSPCQALARTTNVEVVVYP